MFSQNIKDKVVIITGASSGLGEATARLLSSEGATVVLAARRKDRIEALAKELSDRGGKALAVPTDVADRQQVEHQAKGDDPHCKTPPNQAVEPLGRSDPAAGVDARSCRHSERGWHG